MINNGLCPSAGVTEMMASGCSRDIMVAVGPPVICMVCSSPFSMVASSRGFSSVLAWQCSRGLTLVLPSVATTLQFCQYSCSSGQVLHSGIGAQGQHTLHLDYHI